MQKEQISFLEKIIDAPSPSGFEWPAQKIYRDYVSKFSDKVDTDVMGSCEAILNSKGNPKVMLAAHIDEIGLIVHYIDDKGFVYFHEIGGVDPAVLPGARVTIHGQKKVKGIIGRTAIHLLEHDERGKKVKISDLWIDLGVKSKKEAERLVSIGNPITVSYGFEMLEGNNALARAFDDKAGVYVIAEVMRLLKGKKFNARVSAVATTQEELGMRGARTSAYAVDAEVGIAVDVTHAQDFPTSNKQKYGDIDLGKGPVITCGANINPKVEKLLIKLAKDNKIPYQIEAIGSGTGTDANIMQMTRGGMATGLISIPLRYMHTPGEVVNLDDMNNAAKLIAAFIKELKPKQNWTP